MRKLSGWLRQRIFVKQLLAFLLVSVFPIFLINQIWHEQAARIINQGALNNMRQLLKQASMSIDNSMNALTTVSLSLVFDNELISILNKSAAGQTDLAGAQALLDKLKQAKNTNNVIYAISIISPGDKVSTAGNGVDYTMLESSDWYRAFSNSGELKAYTPFRLCGYIARANVPTFALLRRINNGKTGQRVGTLVIELHSEPFLNVLEEMESEHLIHPALYSSNGNLIYSSDGRDPADGESEAFKRMLGEEQGVYEGSENTYLSIRQQQIDWVLAGAVSRDVLLEATNKLASFMLGVLALFLLLVVATASSLASQIVRPIRALSRATEQIAKGDLVVEVQVTSRDEVGLLGESFNSMMVKIRALIEEIKRNEQAVREAELKAVQAQINPHFLYNTLNSIRWMAAMHGADAIGEMILSLTRLLEFSGKNTATFVTIGQEVEHAEHYLSLMRMRYGDSFRVVRHYDESVYRFYTIKFILQPLVENAIFHGIEPKGGGVITLSVQGCPDGIHFAIRDDGVGMPPGDSVRWAFSGMGIGNINERLRLHFGESATLRIESEPGQGTAVYFTLPCLEAPPALEAQPQKEGDL